MSGVFVERVCSDTERTALRLSEVDLMGFSFSFDLDFLNIFSMLEKYNMPLKAKDRDDTYPLVFAGGPVVTSNPMPYSEFFDFFFVGDSEAVNCKAVDLIRENKGKTKAEILKLLSELDGVYVPSLENETVKVSSDMANCVYTPIISEDAFFSNTFIVETTRGCSNCCAFCVASYLNLPQRHVKLENIISVLELGLKHTNKIALLGANVCAHPKFEQICEFLQGKMDEGVPLEMSISSLRADKVKPIIIQTLVRAGQKNLTIAIEAGSERLRKLINKHLTNEQLFETIKVAKDNGLKGLKIYCMYGLPTETQDDLEAFIELAKTLKQTYKGFNLSYSFGTFVPKAHTPFQWVKREESKSLEKKQNYLKKEFHKLGVSATFSSIKWDYYQSLLSKGDKYLADYLIDVYKNGAKLGAFKNCAKGKFDLDSEVYKSYDESSIFPWDKLIIRPKKELLLKEYNRLLNLH